MGFLKKSKNRQKRQIKPKIKLHSNAVADALGSWQLLANQSDEPCSLPETGGHVTWLRDSDWLTAVMLRAHQENYYTYDALGSRQLLANQSLIAKSRDLPSRVEDM